MRARLLYALPPAAALVAGVLGWEALAAAGRLDPLVYPAPSEIARSVGSVIGSDQLPDQLLPTLAAMLSSFALAVVVGSVLGVAIGRSQWLYELLYPGIAAFYALPKVTVFPIFLLFLGLGLTQRTAYGAFFGVFPLLVNTIAGVRDLNTSWLLLARSLGMGRVTLWRTVVFPAVLPLFAAGLRLAFVYCGIGVLLSEMFVAPRGLGQVLVSTAGSIRMAGYFAYTLIVFAVFALVTWLLRLWEQRLAAWRTVA
jgi:ABC-type nitrate/sulfonate/bicarbonate transport system permease component